MCLTVDEQQKARHKALHLLEHMDRTKKGLTDRLRQAGFSSAAAEDAAEWAEARGYIDDFRYAAAYLMNRCTHRSRRRLLLELQEKGIRRETALAAWEEVAGLIQPDEDAVLKATVQKKCMPGSELDEKEFRRLYGFLLRRGFEGGDISRALEELNIRRVNS